MNTTAAAVAAVAGVAGAPIALDVIARVPLYTLMGGLLAGTSPYVLADFVVKATSMVLIPVLVHEVVDVIKAIS